MTRFCCLLAGVLSLSMLCSASLAQDRKDQEDLSKARAVAIDKGLRWLAHVQQKDGSWSMEGPYPDAGKKNDIAATAFGLLPFLMAEKSPRQIGNNPFADNVTGGLRFLLSQQDKKTGEFSGGGIYAHCLATMAVSQAYAITGDRTLRKPCQHAIDYLLKAQHDAGGWRYVPKQPGDTSVTSCVVLALMMGKEAGMAVPKESLKKAINYLDTRQNADGGYGYVSTNPTYTMSAAALHSRWLLQDWDMKNPSMRSGIEKYLKTHPPGSVKNNFYYFFATKLLSSLKGDFAKGWEERMCNQVLLQQEDGKDLLRKGSWPPNNETYANVGGRMMATSLNLQILEIYEFPKRSR